MGRRGFLSGLSVHDLQRELRKRQRRVGTLARRRDRFAAKVDSLNSEIAALGGLVVGRNGMVSGRKRPKNEMSLVEALSKVLHGKTMGVTEVAQAVQKIGYVTTSPSFRTIVNQTLINNSNKFKRVERGQYTVK